MFLFFLAALCFLIATVFFVMNRENNGSSDALKKCQSNETLISAVDEHLIQVKNDLLAQLYAINATLNAAILDYSKLKNKVEYLEMKSDAQARAPQKPIQVSLVYRKFQPKTEPMKTTVLAPDPAVLKNVKKKLSELSN